MRIVGGRSAVGDPVEVAVGDGEEEYDASGLTVVPGLIDLQVNGAGGIDLTDEPERLWEVASIVARFGVTAFAPTVITSSPSARTRALATLAAGPPSGWAGAQPLGLHFEGPFLNPARKGAHPERWLTPPTLEAVAGWSPERGVVMVTIAPELPGALEVIAALSARGVVVSVGHSEATAVEVAAAVEAGARAVTHLGNAMPPLSARAPGIIGAVLDGTLVAGVIADGVHLDAVALRVLWRALAPDRFLAVTDTTAALGIPDGTARLGDHDVIVRAGAVRLADGTIAGSAASMPQCLRTIVETAGATLEQAVAACTAVPERLLGRPRQAGDLTLLDDALDVAATVVGGTLVYERSR